MTPPVLTIDLGPEPGMARLSKAGWVMTVALADLPRWQALYRRLWARGGKSKDHSAPGPWAAHYESDLRALSAAIAKARS
jgi:hypothetical protein